MTIKFQPAKRDRCGLLIGLAGPSSSGKTYSALKLATGITSVTGGSIFVVDTESRRALHYADEFTFTHGSLEAPFRPAGYLEAVREAKKAGASVVIVDSMSHEHEGPGGILEWHEEELERMAGSDFKKRERVKFTAWIKPKAEHNKFVNGVLQANIHLIFCFRAKKKLEMVKNGGKTDVVERGFQPICSDRFEYEMTSLLMLPPGSEGTPDLTHDATKLQNQHKDIFPAGVQISEKMGAALATWAQGDAVPDSTPVERISANQALDLQALIDEVGADSDGFMRYFKITDLAELPAPRLNEAVKMLEAKRAKAS